MICWGIVSAARQRLLGRRGDRSDDGQPDDAGHDHAHDRQANFTLRVMPLLVAVQERQEQQHQDGDAGDDRRAQPFQLAGEILEHLEQEQEIPLRARDVGGVIRVGLGFGGNAQETGQQDQDDKDRQRDQQVLVDAVGPEALAFLQGQLVFFQDGLFVVRLSSRRSFSPACPGTAIRRA